MSTIADFPEPGNKKELFTTTMSITPAQAQRWLGTMDVQRRIRTNKLNILKRQRKEGRWRANAPHGIVIDWDGNLIDGQHRLTMIVELDMPTVMRVTFNADPNTFLVIDGAISPKDLADALHHEGVAKGQSTVMAEAVRMLFREHRGLSIWLNEMVPSNDEAVEIFRKHPLLVQATDMASKVRICKRRSLLVYFIYKGLLVSEAKTSDFVNGLASGELLVSGNPALLLRNTWIKEATDNIKRSSVDIGIAMATTLLAALRGRRMSTWRGVEFGKGKTPAIGPPV
jgi:hypothetical protein